MSKNKNVAEKAINAVERSLNWKTKVVFGISASLLILTGIHGLVATERNDITLSAVKVTNRAETSGGSGVILESNDKESLILTNAHVCGVIEKGGLISGRRNKLPVRSYLKSESHDLCLIKVGGNMGVETKIASNSPNFYYEKATISGHPKLLPNVVTSGHFSGQMLVQVITGFRACTAADYEGPYGLLCVIMGGMPIITEYQSTLVTATIMPGSSGSGVYNQNDELTGLAFAGSGALGYAWTVPYENMRYFLEEESKELKFITVSSQIDLSGAEEQSKSFGSFRDLQMICKKASMIKQLESICSIINQDIMWRK